MKMLDNGCFRFAALRWVFDRAPLSYVLMQLLFKNIYLLTNNNNNNNDNGSSRAFDGDAVLKEYGERNLGTCIDSLGTPNIYVLSKCRNFTSTAYIFFCSRCFLRDMLLTGTVQKKSAYFFLYYFFFLVQVLLANCMPHLRIACFCA